MQGWLRRAGCPQTQVLPRSHLAIAKGCVQRPFVLFFSFFSQSVVQAGTPLPAPAAGTAFIKALPPNQTPFVRETDARGSSAGTDAPMVPPANKRCSVRLPGVPHSCTRTHTRVPAARLGLLSSVQDGVLGHRPPSPELHSFSQSDGHPGDSPPQAFEPLPAAGCPATAQPPTHPGQGWPGAAAPVVFAQLPGLRAPSLICSPCFQLPFQRQQQLSSPPAGTWSRGRQRKQRPPTSGTQGLMLIKRTPALIINFWEDELLGKAPARMLSFLPYTRFIYLGFKKKQQQRGRKAHPLMNTRSCAWGLGVGVPAGVRVSAGGCSLGPCRCRRDERMCWD